MNSFQLREPTSTGSAGGRSREKWLFIVSLVLTVAFFFRSLPLSGFEISAVDRTDSVIQISLLEHWFNVFRGISRWNAPGYFIPHQGTLGYNDAYFLYGIIYTLFRSLGIEPFLATEFVNVVVKSIGFAAIFIVMRRIVQAPFNWSILGAILFTLSHSTGLHPVSLTPA